MQTHPKTVETKLLFEIEIKIEIIIEIMPYRIIGSSFWAGFFYRLHNLNKL